MTTVSDSAWRPSVEFAARPQPAPAATGRRDDDEGFRPFGADGFTFSDFLDIINPLHHIPVIGTLYRHFTGDNIDPGSRVFGGTLFFGPVGLVTSIGDVLIRDATGKDMGQHVLALLNEGDAPRPAEVAEAAGAPGTVLADVNADAEALDPVTAWAVEEVAYRQAMAAKVQASIDARPEVSERQTAPTPAVAAAYADSRQALVAAGLAQPLQPSQPSRLPARLTAEVAGAKSAQSISRHTRQSAAMYAATTYGRAEQRDEPRKRSESDEAPMPTPPGAVAPLGGWFSTTMLKAHEKYQAGAFNAADQLPTTLDVRH